jgi:hypothetical protein
VSTVGITCVGVNCGSVGRVGITLWVSTGVHQLWVPTVGANCVKYIGCMPRAMRLYPKAKAVVNKLTHRTLVLEWGGGEDKTQERKERGSLMLVHAGCRAAVACLGFPPSTGSQQRPVLCSRVHCACRSIIRTWYTQHAQL